MKRIAALLPVFVTLTACSVQEKMSPWIFVERMRQTDKNLVIDTENSFFENEKMVCYAVYADKTKLVFEISTDEHGNSDKISLACVQTDKAADFVLCAKSIASVYSTEDDSDNVAKELFGTKELSDECRYYETQWRSYAAVLSENGLYFSVESKKLVPQTEVEFSLKQNDIVEY